MHPRSPWTWRRLSSRRISPTVARGIAWSTGGAEGGRERPSAGRVDLASHRPHFPTAAPLTHLIGRRKPSSWPVVASVPPSRPRRLLGLSQGLLGGPGRAAGPGGDLPRTSRGRTRHGGVLPVHGPASRVPAQKENSAGQSTETLRSFRWAPTIESTWYPARAQNSRRRPMLFFLVSSGTSSVTEASVPSSMPRSFGIRPRGWCSNRPTSVRLTNLSTSTYGERWRA